MSRQHKTAHRLHSAISDLTFRATAQPLGYRTKYTNDAVGNVTYVNYPSSTDVKFQYDSLNRLTNMVDAAGTTKYTYTSGNQLWTEVQPFTSSTITNTYTNRLRVSMTLQQPQGLWTNKFVYDAAGRLTNITSPAGVFSYTPGASSPGSLLIKKIALPNTSYVTNTFDNVARLTGTYLDNSANSVLDSAVYGYNSANQRTAFTNAAGVYYQYYYDNIGQLKVADSSVNTEDRGYSYDSAWNVNWFTNNGTAHAFTVDGKNELTNWWPTGAGGVYDLNGNRTAQNSGSTTLSYDDENRLTSIIKNATYNSGFVYDGLGRLRERLDYTWNGFGWNLTTTILYIYDGNRVIQERNANNGANDPIVSYTRGPDLSGSLEGAGGIGGLLARSSGYSIGNWTTNHFYHADGNGNITYLEDTSQAMAATYRYDPFGNAISSSGAMAAANTYRASSREQHAGSGLYVYLYRFYDPASARWLNRDPLGDEAILRQASKGHTALYSDILAFEGRGNLYRFDYNNPYSYVDKDGRTIVAIPVIVIGGVAVGALVCAAIPSCMNALSNAVKGVLDGIQSLCKSNPKPPSNPCSEWAKYPTVANCEACCLSEFQMGSTNPRNQDAAQNRLLNCRAQCESSGGARGPAGAY